MTARAVASRSFIPADTDPVAWAAQTAAYRRMTGAQRVAVVYRLNALARETSRAGIRSRHPAYSADEVHGALFRLMHGDALAREVWPDRPLVEP